MKNSCALILFALCLAAPLMSRAQQPTPPAAPPPVTANFKLKGLDGKTYELAGMRGNILLVSFGATWCAPCDAELQALEELQQEFKNQPVKFLWVSLDREDEASDSKLRSYAKSKGLTFPVLRDPEGAAYTQFSVRRRIPLVVFFNREGRLALPQHTGMAEPEMYKRTMRHRINNLLQTQAPGVSNGAQ